MKKSLLLFSIFFISISLYSQTLEELKAQKAELDAQIGTLQGQVSAINGQIASFPGWYKGAFGTIGFNTSSFDNWVNASNPNSRNTTIMASFNGFANNIQPKYFWRNSGAINLGWQKLIEDTNNNTDPKKEFTQTADVFSLTSLYGRNISSKLAVSALGEYRTTLLNNFNNPGYLDMGVGFTWTPMKSLVVVFHPLNYNFVFAEEGSQFESSLGTKLVADYNTNIGEKVKWRSNLSAFLSYKDLDGLSNYTWTNGFSFTAWKGIGVGIEHAVRVNKQETGESPDGNTQQYWIIGLTYNI